MNKFFFLLLTILLLVLGCSQSESNTCRFNQDCEEPLICCYSSLESQSGLCTQETSCISDGGTADADADADADAEQDIDNQG